MSIRLRLLIIIGASLTIMWSSIAAWMFMDMRHELRTVLDDRLAASAHMVAGLMSQLPPSTVPAAGIGKSPLDVLARDGVACEVSMTRGEVNVTGTVRTEGSPSMTGAPDGYGTYTYNGKAWRVYVLQQGDLRIATADRIDVRHGLLHGIVLSGGMSLVVALIGSLLLLWFGIGRGLVPVERVRRVLLDRTPDDVTPMQAVAAPPELRPLVETIEHLLERMQGAIVRERRFTDDAAHELRTPLTAIKTHLQVARLARDRDSSPKIVSQALDQADEGVARMQSTLNQLLLLARLDGHDGQGELTCTSAVAAMEQACADVLASHALASGRINMLVPNADVDVLGAQSLIVSALRNLLDNALRYTPQDSPVELSMMIVPSTQASSGKTCIRFIVADHGAGLGSEECTQAVARFWRRAGDAEGSGLGLSIVNAIALHYAGQLRLENRKTGGLVATLDLPGC